jgi:DnaJ-class molecular chaperone
VSFLSFGGNKMNEKCVILAYPISEEKLKLGAADILDLGEKRYRILIPPETKFDQKLRLKGLAGHIHSAFSGEDLYLLLKKESCIQFKSERDIILDLPIKFDKLRRSLTKRINFGDDRYDVKIPGLIKEGQYLRMKGIAYRYNGGYPGNILLKIVEKKHSKWDIQGFFSSFFKVQPQVKFGIRFTLPFFFEISGEFIFMKSQIEFQGNYKAH